MSIENGTSSGNDTDVVAEEYRANCARLNIIEMKSDELNISVQQTIEAGLLVDDDGRRATYKCPVPVCDSIVTFTIEDGEYNRDGMCPFVMATLNWARK